MFPTFTKNEKYTILYTTKDAGKCARQRGKRDPHRGYGRVFQAKNYLVVFLARV